MSYKCTQCSEIYEVYKPTCIKCSTFWSLEEASNEEIRKENKYSQWKYFLPKKFDYKDSKNEKRIWRELFNNESLNNIFWWWLTKWSVTYLSAEPWTWKSTFLWQILGFLKNQKLKVLYYSWEENEYQIAQRLERLYPDDPEILKRIDLYFWESLESLLWLIERDSPDIVIVDSLQKIKSWEKDWETWSISQQKYCIDRITFELKSKGITWFVIGHVNKDWALAWAKMIEHIVDGVYIMWWQTWRTDSIRLLKSLKSRFGWTDNVVVMKMWNNWFTILDPKLASKAFVEESWEWAWTVFSGVLEWNQLLLIEIQTLITSTAYNFPKRVSIWLSAQRLDILIATLLNKTNFPLNEKDIFLNVIGPIWKDNSNWLDLWVIVSLLSSVLQKNLKEYVFLGEVGLLGEIRTIPKQDELITKLKNIWYDNSQIITRDQYKSLDSLITDFFKIRKK